MVSVTTIIMPTDVMASAYRLAIISFVLIELTEKASCYIEPGSPVPPVVVQGGNIFTVYFNFWRLYD